MTEPRRQEQEDTAHVQTALDHLKEKFEVVRIFVSRFNPEDDVTLNCTMGHGSFYAQMGQVNMWVQHHDRSGLAGHMMDMEEEDEDGPN